MESVKQERHDLISDNPIDKTASGDRSFMSKHASQSRMGSPFMAKSPLKNNDEPRRGKKTRKGKYTDSTEYIRGGRAGDTGGRSVEIESVHIPKEDIGDAAGTGTADKDVTRHTKTVRTKSGKVKTKEITAKRAARIKKRKEKTHSTELK